MDDFDATTNEFKANEFKAWHLVIDQLRSTFNVDDVNEERYEGLFASITAWGELLADLRYNQTEWIRTEARSQALLRVVGWGSSCTIPPPGPSELTGHGDQVW